MNRRRHKLLDVIGDLALVGYPFKAHIIANRPGHASNVKFAKKIKEHIKKLKNKQEVPRYDPNVRPVLDIQQVEQVLPHRYPFLMVDKVIELTEKVVIAIKNVSYNEPFFQGHFPNNSVMPGVLQVEALAQAGGFLAIPRDTEDKYDTYFLKIENCKFKQKVVPGDTLILKMELLQPIRRGICEMKGTIFVGQQNRYGSYFGSSNCKKTKSMSTISPMAHIHQDAKIGANVTVDPFAVIHGDVTIGDGSHIMSHAVIMDNSIIGKNCLVYPGAVVGAIPQDLKFVGEKTTVEIGDGSTIRECVTINRGTKDKWKTVLGQNCLIMAYAHIAHDCILGDNVILANAVQLAGHVEVGNYAIISGLSGAVQFSRIGAHAYVAGNAVVRKDVPPFVKAAREPLTFAGVNSVGLHRKKFSAEKIQEIVDIYRIIFLEKHTIAVALSKIEASFAASTERDLILNFIKTSQTGIIKRPSKLATDDDTAY